MISRNKLIIYIFLICTASVLSAQIANLQVSPNQVLREEKGKKFSGSRFLYEGYKNGLILDFHGEVTTELVRFDGHKNNIEVYNDGKPVIIKKYYYPEIKIEFFDEVLGKKVNHVWKNKFVIQGYGEDCYFEVIDENKNYVILKDFSVDVVELKETGYGEGSEVTLKYVPKIKYFVKAGDNIYELEKLNKLEVSDTFGKENVKDFIKQEKLKFKEEGDLIRLVQHLNEARAL